MHPDAGTATGDGVLADDRIDGRQGAVGVMVGQVAVPQLFEEFDRRLRRHLRQAHVVGDVGRLGIRVTEHERRGGQDEQLVVAPPVGREATLDVGVEGLARLQRAVPREDRVGGGGGEFAPVVGVACLEDHRPALGAARHVEPTADVEVRVGIRERARRGVGQEHAAVLVRHDLVAAPGVEEQVRRLEEALGALVALVFGQESAAAEVLAGEGIPRRDHVPCGTTFGEMVE